MTGKSKVAVDIVVNRQHMRTLILCPLSVVPVWEKQFKEHAGAYVRVVSLGNGMTVKGKRTAAHDAYHAAPDTRVAVVVNYDSARTEPLAAWLTSVQWDCVILDESHRIKAPGGKASWLCKALAKKATQRLCLTGTPMPHSPLDIYAQYRFLDPSIYGTSFTLFKHRYAIPHPVFPGQVKGFKNQEDLQQRYQSIAFRVTKDDALDLPPVSHVEVPVTLGKKSRGVYDDLEQDFYAAVGDGEITVANALVKLLRLQQVTGGYVQDDDGNIQELGDEKANALADILADTAANEPVVVFTRFRHDLDVVHAMAANLKTTSAELSGRRNELADWQAGSARVLAVQIQAGGVGVDLTRARYTVFFSLGYSLGDYEQALARSHRPGQTRPVTNFHLVAQNTVDQKVYKALAERKQVVEAIIEERSRQ